MINKEAIILNESGFHLRPAQLFMEKANEFSSDINIINEDGDQTDAKSILGLMTLGLVKGSKLTLELDGEDEEAAATALLELINSKFGEE